MQFGKLTLKRCRYGWMIFSGPLIGKCFDLYGEYSESEVTLMRQFIAPGDVVIDVGANIGDLTLPLSQMVGDAGRVYAIESHPETYQVLCANLALNEVRNTKPINAFIADSPNVDVGSAAWGQHAYVSPRWDTPFMTIDDLDLPSLKLLKIDVDGKELNVLKSGEMQIERFRPILYFENDLKELSEPLLKFAIDLGYSLYWHVAPIFAQENFFGNPQNHWSPQIASLMVLGIPNEQGRRVDGFQKIESSTDWLALGGGGS